jgi:hypothetical protein
VMITPPCRAGCPASFSAASVVGAVPRHFNSAVGGLHHLLDSGAGCFGASAVTAGMLNAGGCGADRAGGLAVAQTKRAPSLPRPPFWANLKTPSGAGRAGADSGWHAGAGWFTDRAATLVAVFYGLHWHGDSPHHPRSGPVRNPSRELSAVILLVVSLAGIFAYSLNLLGIIDPLTEPSTPALVNTAFWRCG